MSAAGRLLIIGDHAGVLHDLRTMVELETCVGCVAVSPWNTAINQVEALHPSVILMDLDPGGPGPSTRKAGVGMNEIIAQIRRFRPGVVIVALSMLETPEPALRHLLDGYFIKGKQTALMLAAIQGFFVNRKGISNANHQ